MKDIIKWSAIAVIAFIVIRILLGILFGLIKWIFNLFLNVTSATFEFLNSINLGMTILTLIVMGVIAVIYFNHNANKSYEKVTRRSTDTSANVHSSKQTTSKEGGNKYQYSQANTNSQSANKGSNKHTANSNARSNNANKGTENSGKQEQSSHKDFVMFAKSIAEKDLKELTNKKYIALCKSYAEKVGFGASGANEFVGSLILSDYQPDLKKRINEGYSKVFAKEWSPLQFSDYMDGIVKFSEVPYAKWSEVYRYLEQNHRWIQQHDCAKQGKRMSPEVESTVHNAFFGSTLDLDDVASLTEYAISEASAGRNDEAISKLKHVIECMSTVIINNQDVQVINVFDRPYWSRMMLELSNAITFYCATVYNSYSDKRVTRDKYAVLADLVAIALIAVPRENNYRVALDTLLHILAEVNMQRGIALHKDIENIKDMPWSLEQAMYEVKHLLISDDILNRIK